MTPRVSSQLPVASSQKENARNASVVNEQRTTGYWLLYRQRLNELDAVAKGIARLEADVAGNWDAFEHRDATRVQPSPPRREVRHFVGEMGFRRGTVHTVVGADVQLQIAQCQPEP